MKYLQFVAASALVLFLIVSVPTFGQQAKTRKSALKEKGKKAQGADSSARKYGIASAIISMESVTMGLRSKNVLYFDQYGVREATETFADTFDPKGRDLHVLSITKDGWIYTLDLNKRTGTRSRSFSFGRPGGIDFARLTPELMNRFGLRKEGTISYLNRTCDVWKMEDASNKIKGNYLVWNNIPLRSDVVADGVEVQIRAIEIEENVAIPPVKFDIPDDIEIKEISSKAPPPPQNAGKKTKSAPKR